MTTVVTLNVGDYCGRGVEYTNILYDSIKRNLPKDYAFKFVVFLDKGWEEGYHPDIHKYMLRHDPPVVGWWNKLSLFKSGVFHEGERVLYLDLSCVITGSMQLLLEYTGPFTALSDLFEGKRVQSSVMAWAAGENREIWDKYAGAGFPQNDPEGDQWWIDTVFALKTQRWQTILPRMIQSYKAGMAEVLPPDASVLVFHGYPKPHDLTNWISDVWKINGKSGGEIAYSRKGKLQQLMLNIHDVSDQPLRWLGYGHRLYVALGMVGTGRKKGQDKPEYLYLLDRIRDKENTHLWCYNDARDLLLVEGIKPKVHVIIGDTMYAPVDGIQYFVASLCPPPVFEALKGQDVTIFHIAIEGAQEFLDKEMMLRSKLGYVAKSCTLIQVQQLGAIAINVAAVCGYNMGNIKLAGVY